MSSLKKVPEIPKSVLMPGDIDPIRIREDGRGFFIESKTKGRSGQRSLKIAIDRYFGGDPLNSNCKAEVYQSVVIQPQCKYRASFWYRGRGTGREDSVRLVVRTSGNSDTRVIGQESGMPTDDWQEISFEFVGSEASKEIEVAVQFVDCGVLEVDDVSLVDVGTKTEFLVNTGFEEGWLGWSEPKTDEQVGSIWVTNSDFISWGLNYDRTVLHGEDYIMEEVMELSPEKIDKDLRIARQTGANTIRVFLQTSRFEPELFHMDPVHIAYLDLLINLGKKHNLRLDITGLSHIDSANIPEWFFESDEQMVDGEVFFWRELARRYVGESIIFFFNIQNEPFIAPDDTDVVVFGSFTMSGGREFSYCHNHFLKIKSLWADWVQSKYKTQDALSQAWDDFSPGDESIEVPNLPDPKKEGSAARCLDFQVFRMTLAEEWVAEISSAIRSEDPDRLITIGFIPNFRLTAFVPYRLAQYLDFVCLHIYPERKPEFSDSVTENLAFNEIWLRFSEFGKPIVIEEWFSLGIDKVKPEEWLDIFLEATLPYCSGWISFYHVLLHDKGPGLNGDFLQGSWIKRFTEIAPEMYVKELPDSTSESVQTVDMADFYTDGKTLDELIKMFIKSREEGVLPPKLKPNDSRINKCKVEGWSWRQSVKN